jgi:hypothetical protein
MNPNIGWIYVMRNKAMPGLFKIGFTMDDPCERANQLSCPTGVPMPARRVCVQGMLSIGKKYSRSAEKIGMRRSLLRTVPFPASILRDFCDSARRHRACWTPMETLSAKRFSSTDNVMSMTAIT